MKKLPWLAAFVIAAMFSAVALAEGPEGRKPIFGGERPQGREMEGGRPKPQGGEGLGEIFGRSLQALRGRLTAAYDSNANGLLERPECEVAVNALANRRLLMAQGVLPAVSEQDVLTMFDVNSTGQLEPIEFMAACKSFDSILGEGASGRIAGKQQGQGERPFMRGKEGFGGQEGQGRKEFQGGRPPRPQGAEGGGGERRKN